MTSIMDATESRERQRRACPECGAGTVLTALVEQPYAYCDSCDWCDDDDVRESVREEQAYRVRDRVSEVADCRVESSDRLRVAAVAPDSSCYADGTEPGGAWDEECDRLIAGIRAALPAGWVAQWSDDDVLIEREARS